jgi:flagellar biosynthesis protein FliR
MVLTEAQVLTWLGHFLWPFLRITGIFLTDPFYGSNFIPSQVKALLAAAFAASLAFWLPDLPAFPGDPATAILQGVIQIGFGAALGMAMQIVVAAIACAGEIIGLSMGLGFAELQFQVATTETPVLYDIMTWAGLMAYLASGGPIWLFAAVAHSFQSGVTITDLASLNGLTALGGTLISTAVWLALPVLAVCLSINLTVGLTTVFAPQMNLLTIGFPLLILGGLWIFTASIGTLDHAFLRELAQATHSISQMLPHG